MSTVVSKINFIIEQLPEQKQNALLTIVQSMVDPEDFLTAEDLSDIKQSREDLACGEFYTLEDVEWK